METHIFKTIVSSCRNPIALILLTSLLLLPTYSTASSVPVADFTAAPTIGCNPVTVAFTNTSTGGDGPLSYQWEFENPYVGNGTSTEENPTAWFYNESSGGIIYLEVKFTVTDADGDISVMYKDNYVAVNGYQVILGGTVCRNVTAGFTASPTIGDAPLTVSFTNSTTGYTPPFSYEWDFDNDGVVDSTEANPTYTYIIEGIYTVKLKATDPYGRTGTTVKTAHILAESVGHIAAGYEHTLFIKPDGSLYAWGHNDQGQLGNGTTIDRLMPYRVGSDSDWVAVSAGWKHSIALKKSGTLWSWGDNDYGQLGDGTTTDRYAPVHIGSATDWIAIAAGGAHNLGLKANGTLYAWGLNSNGQIGDGTTTTRLSPVQIGSDTYWISISAGWEHSAAIKSDRSLYTWGWNDQGQLGDGTTTDRYSPAKIGLNDWDQVSAGWKHIIAIKENRSLSAWGDNDYGELGDGTTTDRHTPVQIGSDTDWHLIAAGGAHNLALKTDGGLWAWGGNWQGQIGDGTTTQRNAPKHIGSDMDWNLIAGGWEHSLALKTDASLYSWGWNDYGQIGDGTTNDRLAPAIVLVGGTLPAADFTGTPTSGVSPLTVNFTNTTIGGDAPFTYEWDFNNDGVVDSTAENPSHIYTGSGAYTVSLKVTDKDGDTNTVTKQNYVTSVTGSVPSADFTALPTYGCDPLTVNFTNTSTGGDAPLSYQWHFNNDGIVDSTAENPSLVYENLGTGNWTYTVNLTVTDADGDTDTMTKSSYITVYGYPCRRNPVAAFSATPLSGAIPLAVNFTDSSLKATGYTGALSYEWDFDNNGTVDSTAQNPLYAYNNGGIYTAKLTVTDTDGRTDSEIKTNYIKIWVGALPVANFTGTPTGGQIPITVNFTNTTTGGDAPFTYEWDFNSDGVVDSTAENPSHVYTGTGSYTVTLKVTDTDGDTDTVIKQHYITPTSGSVPVADFTALPTAGCDMLTVNFTNASTGGDGTLSYSWDFGDGIVSTAENPSHYYSNERTGTCTYAVKLTVTDADGDSNTIIKNNYITVYGFSCNGQRAWVDGTSYMYKLQEAYAAASSAVKSKNITFSENINFDIDKIVTIEGGYDSGYTAVAGMTTISGNVIISSGTVIMENFVIE